jgi:chemotaxis protein MotA
VATTNQNRKASSVSLGTVFGLIAGFSLVIAAVLMGGSPGAFFDGPAMLIVLGGTFAVTMASFSPREVLVAFAEVSRGVVHVPENPSDAANQIISMADQARRAGVLSLQQVAKKLHEQPFLQQGMALVIDGTTGEEIERLMRREAASISQRQRDSADVLRKAAEISPAMGLIGTLVGLVQMLSSLDDPSKIGPAMAIALLTTFYGAVLAYMVFSPLASKLERNTDEEALVQNVYLLGLGSIGRQENPRRLEIQLNALLPPAHRVDYFH